MPHKFYHWTSFLLMLSFLHQASCLCFDIRLWPTNTDGTQGLVEVLYNRTWGFVGSPVFTYSDTTAGVLCKKLGISDFGYGANWAPMGLYSGYSWLLQGLNCYTVEGGSVCNPQGKWIWRNYTSEADWGYRYGSRLYCTDIRLAGSKTYNTGIIESKFNDEDIQFCLDEIDPNMYDSIARAACQSIGYDKAARLTPVTKEPNVMAVTLECDANVKNLSECRHVAPPSAACANVANVHCIPIRFQNLNKAFIDEGTVEMFNQGAWGMVGNPGYKFNDRTAEYLCNEFGFGPTGFGVTAHHLGHYEAKSVLNSLSCIGNETDIMECVHTEFSSIPPVVHTYQVGTWLYCFPFALDAIRLTEAIYPNEGRVVLDINGRSGSICTYGMKYADKEILSKVVCRELGYSGITEVVHGNSTGNADDLFWMSRVTCTGTETSITQCTYDRGSSYDCFQSPTYLRVRCKNN